MPTSLSVLWSGASTSQPPAPRIDGESYLWSWSQWWRSKRSRRTSTARRLCAAWAAAPPSPGRQSPPRLSWTSGAVCSSAGTDPPARSSPPGTPARRRSRRPRSGRWRCRWWGRGSSRFASSWCCGEVYVCVRVCLCVCVCQGDGRRVSATLEDGELGGLMTVPVWRSAEPLRVLYEPGSCSFSTTPPSVRPSVHTSLPPQESSPSIPPSTTITLYPKKKKKENTARSLPSTQLQQGNFIYVAHFWQEDNSTWRQWKSENVQKVQRYKLHG